MNDRPVDDVDADRRIRLVTTFDRAQLTEPRNLRWRLLSLNGRSLGSSAHTFATADEAIADFDRHAASVRPLSITVAHRARHGHWTWALHDEMSQPVAQADRVYERRASCVKAARRMVLAISNSTLVGERGRREPRAR